MLRKPPTPPLAKMGEPCCALVIEPALALDVCDVLPLLRLLPVELSVGLSVGAGAVGMQVDDVAAAVGVARMVRFPCASSDVVGLRMRRTFGQRFALATAMGLPVSVVLN